MSHTKTINKNILLTKPWQRLVFSLPVLMFGVGFAIVPFYNVLCKNLGLNGKTSGQIKRRSTAVDLTRSIRVELTTQTNQYLPYEFFPHVVHIRLHLGENMLIYFEAKNLSNHTLTVQAIPSVSPGNAAKYLRKTECFCFTQQTFIGSERRVMPVLFHIDPKLPQEIHTITLAYTLFKVNKQRAQVSTHPLARIA